MDVVGACTCRVPREDVDMLRTCNNAQPLDKQAENAPVHARSEISTKAVVPKGVHAPSSFVGGNAVAVLDRHKQPAARNLLCQRAFHIWKVCVPRLPLVSSYQHPCTQSNISPSPSLGHDPEYTHHCPHLCHGHHRRWLRHVRQRLENPLNHIFVIFDDT